jgi:hypothetical protein
MNHLHRQRIRQGIVATLTGVLALPATWAFAPVTAQAAPACTQTISGAHSGVLNVAGNQKLCLQNAVQDGAVNVAPDGALSVVGSTITGAVTLKSGYSAFDFCASKTVRGAISATGGKGAVLVGGGDVSCPANNIDGAVTLDANKGGVTVAQNYIAGAVTSNANLNGTTISGNRIAGALTCTANVPAPTNGGVRNSVGGGRSGQTCAVNTF